MRSCLVLNSWISFLVPAETFSRMLKKPASIVLASLRSSTYRSVRLASSLAAALLDGFFEHPAGLLSCCAAHVRAKGYRFPPEKSSCPSGTRKDLVWVTSRLARVDLVHLVCLVHLVSLVQPNNPNRPNKQERPAGPRPSRSNSPWALTDFFRGLLEIQSAPSSSFECRWPSYAVPQLLWATLCIRDF
jgi:hypothetical protein